MSRFKSSVRIKSAEILLAFLVIFSGILLGFSSGGFVVNFSRVGFTVVSTIQKGAGIAIGSVTKVVTSVKDIARLQKEYNALTEKLKDYEYMQRNNTEIRKENERLREQLEFASEIQYKNIAAQIIGRDPDNLYSGITIGKGATSGIKKGFPVIAIQNGNVGVVGKVVTVGMFTSLVMPVYDSKCHISARIQNSRDIGIVSGNGNYDSSLNLLYIRKRVMENLSRGDIVVTSGENDNYVKDIPIGRISEITALDYDSNLNIQIEPIIDFLRLENVLVVNQKALNDRPPVEKSEEN
jgi:rod shape-determining protein MreC